MLNDAICAISRKFHLGQFLFFKYLGYFVNDNFAVDILVENALQIACVLW